MQGVVGGREAEGRGVGKGKGVLAVAGSGGGCSGVGVGLGGCPVTKYLRNDEKLFCSDDQTVSDE